MGKGAALASLTDADGEQTRSTLGSTREADGKQKQIREHMGSRFDHSGKQIGPLREADWSTQDHSRTHDGHSGTDEIRLLPI